MFYHTSSDGLTGANAEATVVREKFLQTSTQPLTTLDALIGTFLTTQTSDRTLRVDHPMYITDKVLFYSLAVLDPRVAHPMDVLSPFISVLCHSD